MKRLICLQLTACMIVELLITSCSSVKPEINSTEITTSTTIETSLTTDEDYLEVANQILTLIFEEYGAKRNVSRVNPITTLGPCRGITEEEQKTHILSYAKHFNIDTHDYSNLVNLYFELNYMKSTRLSIKSSYDYYIDYDNIYTGDYDGRLNVSLPAYDPQSGYVLVYKGAIYGPTDGFGALYLYKYTDGQLILLDLYTYMMM